MDAAPPAVQPSAGQAFVGLAVLGWGLSILLGVTPHEDRLVGATLAAFGLALVTTAPRLPRIGHAPPAVLAGLGLIAAAGILGFDLLFHAPLDVTKIAVLGFGCLLVATAPFTARRFRLPTRGRPVITVGTLSTFLLPVVGAPLAVWIFQATFKSILGTTPIEAFIRIGLLGPIAGVLFVLGWDPHVAGQTLTYATPRGPLTVDVGAACSGVQAMALFAGVLALFLIAERPGGRRLALWSLVGIVGVYATNLLRLTTLVVVGRAWGPAALVRTHAEAGWIFFVAWAILFARLARTPASRPIPDRTRA